MTTFICKVMTMQGQIVKIKLKEKDKITCIKRLKKNGMTPIRIETSIFSNFNLINHNRNKNLTATIHAKKKRRFSIRKDILDKEVINFVSLREIREFTTDLYILRKSNFSYKHALLTIINKTENLYFKNILENILQGLKEGKYIYKTMKEYKNVFPIVYINLIKTGELTKSVDSSLEYAISYLENEEKIRNKVRHVLIPNIVAFLGIILMLIIAIVIVIPNLQGIFRTYGINVYLPKFVLYLSRIFRTVLQNWYWFAILFFVLIIIFIKWISNENGKYKFDSLKYKNLIFGKLYFLLDFSRIIRSIYLNSQNKMRLEDALEISKQVTKNSYMIALIEKSINNVYVGKSWFDSFQNENVLNSIILELLKKGTKAKNVHTLDIAIQYMDKEIEKEMNRTLKILPEISYIFVGIALFAFIITILIPCIQIYLGGFLFI